MIASPHQGQTDEARLGRDIPLCPDDMSLRVAVDEAGDAEHFRLELERCTAQSIDALFARRLYMTADQRRFAAVGLHRVSASREAEVLLCSHEVIWTRGIIRETFAWAFHVVGARRLVARIPSGDEKVRELAKRAGFTFEGLALDYFGEGRSAAVYAMTEKTCRWLPQERRR